MSIFVLFQFAQLIVPYQETALGRTVSFQHYFKAFRRLKDLGFWNSMRLVWGLIVIYGYQ